PGGRSGVAAPPGARRRGAHRTRRRPGATRTRRRPGATRTRRRPGATRTRRRPGATRTRRSGAAMSVHPPQPAVREAVARALAEDVLPLGDLTAALVPE